MANVDDVGAEGGRRRWLWWLLSVVLLLPVIVIGVLVALFDPNDFKPQLLAAVKDATGRELVVDGKLRLALALRPTIAAENIRFTNTPGGSRPDMVRLDRIEATVAVLPLLRRKYEVDRVTLVRPDILLETDAKGRGNWLFGEAAEQPTPTSRPPLPAPAAGPRQDEVLVRHLRITDGSLIWRDGQTGEQAKVKLTHLDVQTDSSSAPISVVLDAAWNDIPFKLSGHVGSLNALLGQSSAPWPVRVALSLGKARLNLSGTIAAPGQGKGYALKLDATMPSLAALQPLLPKRQLPDLRDVTIKADVADQDPAGPRVGEFSVRAGVSDLSALFPGLKLNRLEIVGPDPERPMRVTAEGSLDGSAMALAASLAPPNALLAVASGKPAKPLPVDMALSAAGARLTIKGSIGDPRALSGIDLAVNATIPDLAKLGRVTPGKAGLDLPDLRDLSFQTQLASAKGGARRGVVARNIELKQAHIDLSGEIGVELGGRPHIRAQLTSRQIDIDALSRAAGEPSAPAAKPETGDRPGRVIPDTKLPFAALRAVDADVKWRIGALVREGQDVAMVLRAPGLDLRKLYESMGRRGEAHGKVEVDMALQGAGQSAHEIASTATGHLGIAMAEGAVDNETLRLGLLGKLLGVINQGELLMQGRSTDVRCFALRIDAKSGVGETRALLFDSSALLLEGDGGMHFGDETLALRLRAQPKLLGLGVAVPVKVGGTFASPSVLPDVSGAPEAIGKTLQSTAETAVGAVGSGVGTVGSLVGGLLGSNRGGDAGKALTPDACPKQLAIARGGRAGPVPASTESAPATAKPTEAKPTETKPSRRAPRPNLLERLLPR